MTLAREVKAAVLFVPKLFNHLPRQAGGFFEPSELTGSFEERQEAFDEKGVVL